MSFLEQAVKFAQQDVPAGVALLLLAFGLGFAFNRISRLAERVARLESLLGKKAK